MYEALGNKTKEMNIIIYMLSIKRISLFYSRKPCMSFYWVS